MTQNQTAVKIKDSGNQKSQIDSGLYSKSNLDALKHASISIIIPLYNEKQTITQVIDKIPNHQRYEILVIDDGSTDGSIERVKELKRNDVRIIKHQENQGYGAAILTGMKNATGDIIITLDSDGQHNPQEIPNIIKPIIKNVADLVIGSRYLGDCSYKMPLYTKVGQFVISTFLRLLFLQRVYDNQCGFRAIRKDLVKIFTNMRHTGMGFSTELLFKSAFYKYRIVEIPVSVNSRQYGSSHVNLTRIVRSISSCILYYTLKKFKLNINHLFITKIINYFYKKIKYKKIFQ